MIRLIVVLMALGACSNPHCEKMKDTNWGYFMSGSMGGHDFKKLVKKCKAGEIPDEVVECYMEQRFVYELVDCDDRYGYEE